MIGVFSLIFLLLFAARAPRYFPPNSIHVSHFAGNDNAPRKSRRDVAKTRARFSRGLFGAASAPRSALAQRTEIGPPGAPEATGSIEVSLRTRTSTSGFVPDNHARSR